MKFNKLTLALFAFSLSACASLTGEATQKASSPVAASTEMALSGQSQSLGSLSDAQLPEKSCGMILWTLDAKRPSPVFKYVAENGAEIVVGETLVHLTRTNIGGEAGYGIFETQHFESEDGVRVEVTSQFGAEFDGGAYLERGLVKVFAPDGWSIVAPAAGIAGCRS